MDIIELGIKIWAIGQIVGAIAGSVALIALIIYIKTIKEAQIKMGKVTKDKQGER